MKDRHEKLRAQFPGKVVGFSIGNLRIGPVEATTPPKTRVGESTDPVTVNMYFDSWDRVGNDPANPSPAPATVPPYPKINVSKGVAGVNLWYPPDPYSVTVPGNTTLMEAFLPVGNNTAVSKVKDIVTITGTGTATNPDWLEQFTFNEEVYEPTDTYIWEKMEAS